jgi:hypothetical protein
MQTENRPTYWNAIENQITRLRLVESRIDDLRNMLAEDWQLRLSRHQENLAAANDPRNNRSLSAC